MPRFLRDQDWPAERSGFYWEIGDSSRKIRTFTLCNTMKRSDCFERSGQTSWEIRTDQNRSAPISLQIWAFSSSSSSLNKQNPPRCCSRLVHNKRRRQRSSRLKFEVAAFFSLGKKEYGFIRRLREWHILQAHFLIGTREWAPRKDTNLATITTDEAKAKAPRQGTLWAL